MEILNEAGIPIEDKVLEMEPESDAVTDSLITDDDLESIDSLIDENEEEEESGKISDVEKKRRSFQSDRDRLLTENAKMKAKLELIEEQERLAQENISKLKNNVKPKTINDFMPSNVDYDSHEAVIPGTDSFNALISYNKHLTEETIRNTISEHERQNQINAQNVKLQAEFKELLQSNDLGRLASQYLTEFEKWSKSPSPLSLRDAFVHFLRQTGKMNDKTIPVINRINYTSSSVAPKNKKATDIKKRILSDLYPTGELEKAKLL